MSVPYAEVCRLLEPGIRLIFADDPRRLEMELVRMRLIAVLGEARH